MIMLNDCKSIQSGQIEICFNLFNMNRCKGLLSVQSGQTICSLWTDVSIQCEQIICSKWTDLQ